MKKLFVSLLLVTALVVLMATSALAGGGQEMETHRGELGQGSVNQVHVQDPPPFQP